MIFALKSSYLFKNGSNENDFFYFTWHQTVFHFKMHTSFIFKRKKYFTSRIVSDVLNFE